MDHHLESQDEQSAHSKLQKGKRGENIAADYLSAKGYEILDRHVIVQAENTKAELDLVAFDPAENAVVFVEVKYRSSTLDGGGTAAVSQQQLRRIRKGASVWLSTHRNFRKSWEKLRIDVVDVGPTGVRVHLLNIW